MNGSFSCKKNCKFAGEKYYMGKYKIWELLSKGKKILSQEVVLQGWVRAFRSKRFISLNDGSSTKNIQCVLDFENFSPSILSKISVGAALKINGKVVESQGKEQEIEILVSHIKIYGESDPTAVQKTILQPKRHSLEKLREQAHLRFRTNLFSSVMRIRHTLSFAIHQYFSYSYVKLGRIKEEFPEFFRRSRKDKRCKRICTMEEFRERIRGKKRIVLNQDKKGIPQGTPISALLSNIYMFSFDQDMDAICRSLGTFYRRYSDDIVIICNRDEQHIFERQVKNLLKKIHLDLNDKKTEKIEFTRKQANYLSFARLDSRPRNPFQYLGFAFDGKKVLIRQPSLTRYYRRMQRGVNRSYHNYHKIGSDSKRAIRRGKIYKRYSHLGKQNFIKYAYRASAIMNQESIKKQVQKHWNRLNSVLDRFDEHL